MRFPALLALFVLCAGFCYTQAPPSAQTPAQKPSSIWDGVYTEEQAKRGEALYPDGCSRCHGDELEGDEAPALASEEFLKDWKGLTLGDLFRRVRDSMPIDRPGSVSPQQMADLVAFILRENGAPAGKTPLGTNVQQLKEFRIDR